MKKIKAISVVLIFLILFSTFSGIVLADTENGEESSENNENSTENNEDISYYNKYVPEENDISVEEFLSKYGTTSEKEEEKSSSGAKLSIQASGSSSTDSSYDLKNDININVEEQKADTCWAFAALGALRTHIALKEHQKTGEKTTTPDLSEWHMDYLTSKLSGKGFNRDLQSGGNIYDQILPYFKNNDGPVLEKYCGDDDVYNGANDNNKLQKLDNLKPAYYVHEIKIFPSILKKRVSEDKVEITNNNKEISDEQLQEVRKLIKEHIKTNGGLYCSIRTHEAFVGKNNGYPNSWSQYDDGSIPDGCGGHAVTIIGWDDNYDRTNFYAKNSKGEWVKPKENGAYLALNSYGTEFGESGFQWISYEDYGVESNLFGYINVDTTENKYEFTNKNTYTLMKEKLKKLHEYIEIDDNKKTISVSELVTDDLRELNLSSQNLTDTDLEEIFKYKFKNLEKLNLYGNKINNITKLTELSNLKELKLGENNISTLPTMNGNLANLEKLYLADNQIVNITPLTELINLNELGLENNKIQDLPQNISKLSNLKILKLNKNQIKSIAPITKLTTLQELNLTENQIADIPEISNLKKLKKLYLSDNMIEDCSELNFNQYDKIEIQRQKLESITSFKNREISYPQIFTVAKTNGDEITYKNCIENTNGTGIIVNENTASVSINGGKYFGSSIWTITVDSKDTDPPTLTVTKKSTNKDVTVTVEANEDIDLVKGQGWTKEGTNKLTKKYTENTSETIIVQDKNGNKTTQTIKVEIDNEVPSISDKNITTLEDGSLRVQIKLSEPIKIVSKETNWKVSTSGVRDVIYNTYTKEANDTVEVEDTAGNKTTLYIKVKNVNGKLEADISETNEDTDNKDDTSKDNDNKEDTSNDNDNAGDTTKDNDDKTNSNIDNGNKEQGNSTGTNNNENNNGSSNSSNNSSKDSNENNSKNSSEDKSKITSGDKEQNLATSRLPQTGVTQIIIVMLIACAVVSGALFIKYRKI